MAGAPDNSQIAPQLGAIIIEPAVYRNQDGAYTRPASDAAGSGYGSSADWLATIIWATVTSLMLR